MSCLGWYGIVIGAHSPGYQTMKILLTTICGCGVESVLCSHEHIDAPPSHIPTPDNIQLRRKAFNLSIFTVLYNVIEGAISVVAGSFYGSTALLSFGLDSFVEALSGGVMIWRFRKIGPEHIDDEHKTEQLASVLVGITLFLLAGYVIFESVQKLIKMEPPTPSLIGVFIAVISLVVMPVLYVQKNSIAQKIGSQSLRADSNQTLACMFLSVALLVGLCANYFYGLWWADPIAALVISGYLVFEGIRTIRDRTLCSC